MVFTRSAKTYFLVYNSEMERIRTEYASSSDEEEEMANQKRPTRKYVRKVKNLIESVVVVDACPSSSSYPNLFTVDIDFDGAHDAWMANKKRKANGDYAYLCGAPLKGAPLKGASLINGAPLKGAPLINGASLKKCKRYCCDKIGLYSGCRIHYSWEESANKFLVG